MSHDVAVIIPTRDRAELLNSTLAALAGQDCPDFDIVVADHGSTDSTAEVIKNWSDRLRLCHAPLPPKRRSPGWVRDEGVRRTSASTLVFLDCGMLVPPGFVRAHRDYHKTCGRVGIGMCHGYRVLGVPDRQLPDSTRVSVLREEFEADIALRDDRSGVRAIEQLSTPWVYGWSGNLSVGHDLYARAGGFDRDREHIYEDIDLAYRLHVHGGRFGIVDQGWAVHLPHPSAAIGERMRSMYAGWLLSYSRHRSLGLESAWLALPHPLVWRQLASSYGAHCDAMMSFLEEVTDAASPARVSARQLGIDGSALLVGGHPADAARFRYVACARRDLASNDRVWGCAGILIPLSAGELDCVVVTDVWRRLRGASGRIQLLDRLIAEIARVGKEAIFLDPPGGTVPGTLTVDDLAEACSKRGLRWSIR
jgi:glycosyltransferase involved in cell wall biosynthesis